MIKKWEILESKVIFSSPFITLREEKLKRPDGKIVPSYYAIERPEVAYIVPITKDRRIVLVYQYKNGVKELVWEIPAGFIDEGETSLEGAKRELLEETGFASKEFINLGSYSSSLGLARNKNHVFLAKDAEKVGDQMLDQNEEIEVKTFPLEEIITGIKNRQSVILETQAQLAVLLAEQVL
ncbi:MAG: NUDIX hydrolase [Candidatus Woykebacteria bacterium]